MMGQCAESLKPKYSNILLISGASYTFTVSVFSPFLSFSVLDQFQINLAIILFYLLHFLVSSIFIGTRGDRDLLSFLFPILCLWINLSLVTLSSDFSLLEHLTGMYALLQRLGWDNQCHYYLVPVRYFCTVSTRSCR